MLVAPLKAYPVASACFDVVVIGASMGGVEALTQVLERLPEDFPVPVGVVLHIGANLTSQLQPVLRRHCRLPVKWAEAGERLRGGTVYVAPPDLHLELDRFECRLTEAAKVHYTRPAADPLFASAAAAFGARTLGLVLTGFGRDGAEGARRIKAAGGTVIVQHPETSAARSMPDHAIRTECADFVLPLEVIPSALISLVMVPGAAQHFGVTAPLPAA